MAIVSTSMGRLGLAERGDGNLTPLVFLHGVGSDKSAWMPQLNVLGRHRRTMAFDFPGYGESDAAMPGDEEPHDRFARAILAGLDALGIFSAHICGLSLGGVVALAMASLAPDRVASLTIADSFARHPDGSAILARSIAASADMQALAEARVPVLLAQGSDPVLARELVSVMARIPADAFRLASTAVWPADQRERAAAVRTPTLILCGREDRVTPPALSEALASLIPCAQLHWIDEAGHLPNLEQPEAFNSLLDRFLAGR